MPLAATSKADTMWQILVPQAFLDRRILHILHPFIFYVQLPCKVFIGLAKPIPCFSDFHRSPFLVFNFPGAWGFPYAWGLFFRLTTRSRSSKSFSETFWVARGSPTRVKLFNPRQCFSKCIDTAPRLKTVWRARTLSCCGCNHVALNVP